MNQTDTPMTDAAVQELTISNPRKALLDLARRLEHDRNVANDLLTKKDAIIAELIAALEQARGLYAAEEELAEYFRKGLVAAELALSVIASNPVRPMGISTVHAIEARDLARATLAKVNQI